MSKGDFELIAAALHRLRPTSLTPTVAGLAWHNIVDEIANTLDDHFPRFDVNLFLKACGAEVEPVEA